MSSFEQLRLVPSEDEPRAMLSAADVAQAFDGSRLTQARHLVGMTKRTLGTRVGVTAAAIGQYEVEASTPRPELISVMSEVLHVPIAFFLAGRPNAKIDPSMAHFRSLRSTRSYQRAKAVALAAQAWELTYALEKRVQLPWVDLPGFAGGEVDPGVELPRDPRLAAQALRQIWRLGTGPVTHLVRRLESHGIVVVTPPPDPDCDTVDAFSTSTMVRPMVVITSNRTNDVYRHRFTAAHELGHLVLHSDSTPGDGQQEREADIFAAEFLTPKESIAPYLPVRADLGHLAHLQRTWGVSVKSLIYRCREVGILSDSAASRAYQRLNTLSDEPGFKTEPVTAYPGEQPAMLSSAFRLAESSSKLSLNELSRELAWPLERVRELLGFHHPRPVLKLIKDET